jgi:hypothetical protein
MEKLFFSSVNIGDKIEVNVYGQSFTGWVSALTPSAVTFKTKGGTETFIKISSIASYKISPALAVPQPTPLKINFAHKIDAFINNIAIAPRIAPLSPPLICERLLGDRLDQADSGVKDQIAKILNLYNEAVSSKTYAPGRPGVEKMILIAQNILSKHLIYGNSFTKSLNRLLATLLYDNLNVSLAKSKLLSIFDYEGVCALAETAGERFNYAAKAYLKGHATFPLLKELTYGGANVYQVVLKRLHQNLSLDALEKSILFAYYLLISDKVAVAWLDPNSLTGENNKSLIIKLLNSRNDQALMAMGRFAPDNLPTESPQTPLTISPETGPTGQPDPTQATNDQNAPAKDLLAPAPTFGPQYPSDPEDLHQGMKMIFQSKQRDRGALAIFLRYLAEDDPPANAIRGAVTVYLRSADLQEVKTGIELFNKHADLFSRRAHYQSLYTAYHKLGEHEKLIDLCDIIIKYCNTKFDILQYIANKMRSQIKLDKFSEAIDTGNYWLKYLSDNLKTISGKKLPAIEPHKKSILKNISICEKKIIEINSNSIIDLVKTNNQDNINPNESENALTSLKIKGQLANKFSFLARRLLYQGDLPGQTPAAEFAPHDPKTPSLKAAKREVERLLSLNGLHDDSPWGPNETHPKYLASARILYRAWLNQDQPISQTAAKLLPSLAAKILTLIGQTLFSLADDTVKKPGYDIAISRYYYLESLKYLDQKLSLSITNRIILTTIFDQHTSLIRLKSSDFSTITSYLGDINSQQKGDELVNVAVRIYDGATEERKPIILNEIAKIFYYSRNKYLLSTKTMSIYDIIDTIHHRYKIFKIYEAQWINIVNEINGFSSDIGWLNNYIERLNSYSLDFTKFLDSFEKDKIFYVINLFRNVLKNSKKTFAESIIRNIFNKLANFFKTEELKPTKYTSEILIPRLLICEKALIAPLKARSPYQLALAQPPRLSYWTIPPSEFQRQQPHGDGLMAIKDDNAPNPHQTTDPVKLTVGDGEDRGAEPLENYLRLIGSNLDGFEFYTLLEKTVNSLREVIKAGLIRQYQDKWEIAIENECKQLKQNKQSGKLNIDIIKAKKYLKNNLLINKNSEQTILNGLNIVELYNILDYYWDDQFKYYSVSCEELKDKLSFLHQARNFSAHHNISLLPDEDIKLAKLHCKYVIDYFNNPITIT